jgi:hypothetical protein
MALAVTALVATLSFTLPRHGELHRLVCLAPDGGRCDGPLPIDSLHVDRAGTRLSGVFICGGWLSATEDGNQVTVTYLAPYVGPGVRQCAAPTLAVRLHSPIGHRPVLDGVTHHAIAISR